MPLPLETPRLILRLGTEADAPAIVRYYEENREFLAPWEPIRPAAFYTQAYWRERVRLDREEYEQDRAMKLFLFLREAPGTLVGTAHFVAFVRGAGQMCYLGYSLGRRFEGQGYMREGLEAAIAFAFGELNLHRLQANHMPHNARSAGLLARLGFQREGLAREFLLIDGAWRDHVLNSLTNPAWRAGG